jgi:hypothetical protein
VTPTDVILMIADGIRAGTLVPVMGNAEVTDLGYTKLDPMTLDQIGPRPDAFTFKCDVVIEKKTAK